MAKKLTKLDDVLGDEIPKLFKITKASITDDFCNYSFEITDGIGIGDTHSVKGKGIIHDDLREAFNQLNVHLGVIDDAFENEEFSTTRDLINKETTSLYHVTGLDIKGTEGNESIIITGTKYVNSIASRNDIKTSKVSLMDLSAYKNIEELREDVENVRSEVELYKAGKCIVLDDEPISDPNQISIEFNGPSDSDFENAKQD